MLNYVIIYLVIVRGEYMSFSFSGRHMEVGAALTHHAAEACDRLSQKYSDAFTDVCIVITKDSFQFITDLSVKMENGWSFYAKADSKEPYASFDAALQKISTQIKKAKDKENRSKMREDVKIADCLTEQEHEDGPMIISEYISEMPFMSVAEAANLLLKDSKEVFLFKNKLTKLVNAVYLRKDGNIGWLDYK